MKRLTTLLCALWTGAVLAQAPQNISYQAILRDNVNALIQNADNVSVKVTIIQGPLIQNNEVYIENHTTSTNANGLFTIEIGGGTPVTGNYPAISWGSGPFFLKTEIDPVGGTNYLITAISELLSVPFANFANQAARRPGLAGLMEGYWVPTNDEIGLGSIFVQFVSPTSVTLSYLGEDQNGELTWYTEPILITETNLVAVIGGYSLEYVLTETELIVSVNDAGDVFTTTYVRQ